jgi:hypothetical protein
MSGKDAGNLDRQIIRWYVYHGNRFCSMLLGLPSGVNDSNYGLVMDHVAEELAA